MKVLLKWIILPVIWLLILSACTNHSASDHTHQEGSSEQEEHVMDDHADDHIDITQKQYEASSFEIGKLEKKPFAHTIPVTGKIHLPERNKAIVSSYIGGRVDDMELIHGQWVRKNQKLFSITNPEMITLQQEYLEINGQISYLEGEYVRLKLLAEENITAKKNFLRAEADYNLALSKVAGIKERLALIGISTDELNTQSMTSTLNVVAPISGYLTEINVYKGVHLKASESAMEISNSNHLHMELKVLEKDIGKLKKGQSVTYSIQEDPSESLKATIYLIERLVDQNRMINVHCHLEHDDIKKMVPGMYVTAEIIINEAEEIALPQSAVVNFEDHHYVLIRDEEDPLRFNKVEVNIGRSYEDYIEIYDSELLGMDATFLTEGAYFLIVGDAGGGHHH